MAILNAPAVPSNREQLFASRLNRLGCLLSDEILSILYHGRGVTLDALGNALGTEAPTIRGRRGAILRRRGRRHLAMAMG